MKKLNSFDQGPTISVDIKINVFLVESNLGKQMLLDYVCVFILRGSQGGNMIGQSSSI